MPVGWGLDAKKAGLFEKQGYLSLDEGGVGKKRVFTGVMRQVAWMAGARIVRIRS